MKERRQNPKIPPVYDKVACYLIVGLSCFLAVFVIFLIADASLSVR